MGIFNTLPDDLHEVDIIIAGGGAAGCVVAGRLAEAAPELSILVVEAGPDAAGIATIEQPALFTDNVLSGSKTSVLYEAKPSPHVGGRGVVAPAGGVLGGGSCINFMQYSRPLRRDLDAWNTPGWSADELLPFFRKLETFHGPGDEELHGYEGPIHVSGGTFRSERAAEDWIAAAGTVGIPAVEDLADLKTGHGVTRMLRLIGPDGSRSTAVDAYVRPLLRDGKHPNLHVLTEHTVARVLFDGGGFVPTADGVEVVPNPAHQPDTTRQHRPRTTIRARRLVVLSSGGLGTPPILERSGVGGSAVLARAGVPLVAHVPGVGSDYQDHHYMFYPYRSSLAERESANFFRFAHDEARIARAKADGRFGWNAIDAAGKIRPTDDEAAALGPAFEKAWDADFKGDPTRPMLMLVLVAAFPAPPTDDAFELVGAPVATWYPYSRGSVHITGPAPSDKLDFDAGVFTDPDQLDIRQHVFGYKKQREIMRRTAMYRGEEASGHPPFPAGSGAACVALEIEGPSLVDGEGTEGSSGGSRAGLEDIEYSAEDDAVIEEFVRRNVGTASHSLGTAKMAPQREGGVVDPSLSVYGVSGLKVVDLSIVPGNVGCNTCTLAFAVGEKGADIILRELGIVQS